MLRHGDTASRLASCILKESITDALSRKKRCPGLGLTSQTASMSVGCRTEDHQAAANGGRRLRPRASRLTGEGGLALSNMPLRRHRYLSGSRHVEQLRRRREAPACRPRSEY